MPQRSVAPDLFVGRAAELAQLCMALEDACAGHGATVLVTGDAGIGKTRLVAELAKRASATGALVLTGRCLDLVGSGLPYLPFAEALRGLPDSPLLAGPTRPHVSHILRKLGVSSRVQAAEIAHRAMAQAGRDD